MATSNLLKVSPSLLLGFDSGAPGFRSSERTRFRGSGVVGGGGGRETLRGCPPEGRPRRLWPGIRTRASGLGVARLRLTGMRRAPLRAGECRCAHGHPRVRVLLKRKPEETLPNRSPRLAPGLPCLSPRGRAVPPTPPRSPASAGCTPTIRPFPTSPLSRTRPHDSWPGVRVLIKETSPVSAT
jgi:hypothetical protein